MFEGGHLWPSILIETFALWLMSCFRAKCIFSPSNLFCALFYVVVSPHVGLTLLFLGTKDTLSSSKKRHGCGKTIKMVCFILFESRSLCRTNVNSESSHKCEAEEITQFSVICWTCEFQIWTTRLKPDIHFQTVSAINHRVSSTHCSLTEKKAGGWYFLSGSKAWKI